VASLSGIPQQISQHIFARASQSPSFQAILYCRRPRLDARPQVLIGHRRRLWLPSHQDSFENSSALVPGLFVLFFPARQAPASIHVRLAALLTSCSH
jgi:hypothetical protein